MREANRAMEWLKKTVQAGYKDVAHMVEDSDLDALRGRDDFQKLMKELGFVAPAAKPQAAPVPREVKP